MRTGYSDTNPRFTRRQARERHDMRLLGFITLCVSLGLSFLAVASWVGVSAYNNYMMLSCN